MRPILPPPQPAGSPSSQSSASANRRGQRRRPDLSLPIPQRDTSLAVPLPLPPATNSGPSTSHPQNQTQNNHRHQLINPAELERGDRIGSGSGGTVWRVVHRATSRVFALKVIYGNHEDSVRSQICREIEILRDVNHPNVVKCHDMYDRNGEIEVLLEYMDGGSLEAAHVQQEHILSDLARQVLSGLAYLHKRHIVHRDIKPSNLLINSRKNVKIADFGVSRILAQTMDPCNSAIGTVAYMSPERINTDLNHGRYDGYAGDIWSFGVSILEVYIGRFPFGISSPSPSANKSVSKKPTTIKILFYFYKSKFNMYGHSSSNIDGSSLYWGRKAASFRGIVVFFSWVSVHQQQLISFLDLYSSLGWNSLVSNSHFLDAFYPERATSLAFVLINELVEELRIKPYPVVFVAFSGGPKACMHKVFQIIQGTCEGHLNVDESRLVRNCVAGQIYDSSPVDFTSDFCARFGLHPTIQKVPGSSKLVSWVAKGIASGLDGVCLTRFESQRAEYWQALYNSVDLGGPFLILCSDNDEHAPQRVIYNFAQCLLALGGDVELVKLNGSPHLGHYEYYPIQYRAAITSLLEKAASVYSQRICQIGERPGIEGMHDDIAVNSNQNLRRVAVEPSDHFFLPISTEHHSQESRSLQDERNARSVYLPTPSISAHSVLGEFLFDVCVPKNVEGWDIRFSGSVNGQPYALARRHSPFNKIRCNRRSRL